MVERPPEAEPRIVTPQPCAAGDHAPECTQVDTPDRSPRRPRRSLDARWFIDGGMIPFVYAPAALAAGVTLALPLPEAPRLFSAYEGGAERRSETIPNYQVGLLAGGLTLTLGLFDRDARWYHVKGMVQSIATTAAVTQLAKLSFGRHRPSYNPAVSSSEDDRMSFFSGHSSLTTTSTVYLGLYLRQHAFKPWRGDRAIAWWEIPAYASLAALTVYVPYTRVADHKHHLSDVVTGASVGAASAVMFYWYQESRFRAEFGDVSVTPWSTGTGVSVSGTF